MNIQVAAFCVVTPGGDVVRYQRFGLWWPQHEFYREFKTTCYYE